MLKDLQETELDKSRLNYTEKEYQIIYKRYLAIRPLLSDKRIREEIEKHAQDIGVHFTTLYRWLNKYKSIGLSGILPHPSGRKKGKTRLDPVVEDVMQILGMIYYLTIYSLQKKKLSYKLLSIK